MISLDRRYQQGANLVDICSQSFRRRPRGTILPRRILLAESDCERLTARGHFLERNGYEVLSCSDTQSMEKCLGSMSGLTTCNLLADLIICDSCLLSESIVHLIRQGQRQPTFPPLLLILGRGDGQGNGPIDQVHPKGCLRCDEDRRGQMVLVRRWAPY